MEKFSNDTIYSDCKSLLQNVSAQVYTTKFGFTAVYPITGFDGATIGTTLKDFISDYTESQSILLLMVH